MPETDPRIEKLKDYLVKEFKLSVFTVKDIVWKVEQLFIKND